MEDDGLLLNFEVPTTSVKRTDNVKITGGKWKERRKRQLTLQGRGRNIRKEKIPTSGVNSTKVEPRRIIHSEEKDSNNTKSAKESISSKFAHHDPDQGEIKRQKFQEKTGEFGGKNNSYVSSLFTNNTKGSLQDTETTENKTLDPSNAPIDTSSFEGIGLASKITNHLTEHLRLKYPTKVQQSVLPQMINQNQDLFVRAQTGSGKTLAFLLPIFHQLLKVPDLHRESGLFALILVPTRELATQIYGVMETLARCCHHIVPGIVIGGEKKKSEKARLRKGVNLLVATPGRLLDHMENTKSFNVSQIRWLVLDEGDKLMELGFEETISKITSKINQESKLDRKWQTLPRKRVNVLCSATLQANVKKLGEIVLDDPKLISVDGEKEGTIQLHDIDSNEQSAPDQLVQRILVVPPKLRLVTLAALLKERSTPNSRTVVFFSCSDSVDFHFNVFTRDGSKFKKDKEGEIIKVSANDDDEEDEENNGNKHCVLTAPVLGHNFVIHKLHGSLSQQLRSSTLQSFVKEKGYNGAHSVLFCTDVASRGLDLPKISNVIEFDPPFTIEDHLHRIGRTARVGQEGDAVLFLLPGIEEGYVDGKLRTVHPKSSNLRVVAYEKILEKGFADEKSNDNLKNDAKRKAGKWDVHATTFHLDVERWLLEDTAAHNLAVQAFTSHIRAYATHLSSERQFFNVKLLHLGHLAKSFGLRETPKKLGKTIGASFDPTTSNSSNPAKRKNEDPRKKLLRMARLAVKSNTNEFNY